MNDYPPSELMQLKAKWFQLKAEWKTDSEVWDFQAPPAVADITADILHGALVKNGAELNEATFEFLVTFGQVMFSFGQFTRDQGLLREDLTQATFLDEAELEKILKGN